MTTMASRVCSTLEGHPEVNQRRDTQIVFLPLLDKTKFAATPFVAYETRISPMHGAP